MLIAFQNKNFSSSSATVIDQANTIIAEYLKDGLKLTLRQLYYQFVSRDLFPESWIDVVSGSKNIQKNYKRLGSIINDARLAGLIDWNSIEDRGRNLQTVPSWESPESIIESCASQYAIDLWADQPYRVEVWIEKQALEGVIDGICRMLRVPYFSCKGYVSQSEMFDAGYYRLKQHVCNGQTPIILHFGDHDPSGIDMSRDIEERIRMFMADRRNHFEFRRLALNMDQIEQYNPPPNPAKVTDSRFEGYQAEHGENSWELDALDPHILVKLIRAEVYGLRDNRRWKAMKESEEAQKQTLHDIADNFPDIMEYFAGLGK